MNVKKGVIEDIEITGNFFGTADTGKDQQDAQRMPLRIRADQGKARIADA